MSKRIKISVLIVILLNFFTACTSYKYDKILTAELAKEDTIREVILQDLSIIKFIDDGGRYINTPRYVTGTLENGDPCKMALNNIKEIRVSAVKPASINNLDGLNIKEIHLKSNKVIIADSRGAYYNKEKGIISGQSDEKKSFNFRIDDIAKIFTERPDIITVKDNTITDNIIVREIVTLSTNRIYTFDETGGRITGNKSIITGFNSENELIEIHPDSVLYVNVERVDPVGLTLTILGVTALAIGAITLIAMASKESCPFIYSFDGEKYVFDAEPLGGATCKGFERTEYSKLDYLKNIDNSCSILLRNDVDETQYIDEFGLLALKHDSDKVVYPDLEGKFFQIKDPVTPVFAENENGLNLKEAVSKSDNLHWQSQLPVDTALFTSGYRHELIFKFPKPIYKSRAKLIANMGTTLWGSQMIKEMLQLYGSYVDTYYEKVNKKGSEYNQVMNFIETEELYKLKYYIKKGDEWICQGFINGGGPFVTETRVYNLDFSGIDEDTIELKVNPPYGFWSIDYLALEYNDYPPPVVESFLPDKVYDHKGENSKAIILNRDGRYYIMPQVGDFLKISFSTDLELSKSVSFYAKSTGYYEVHTDKSKPMNPEVLLRLVKEPGYIVKYSNIKYQEWKNNYLSSGVVQ